MSILKKTLILIIVMLFSIALLNISYSVNDNDTSNQSMADSTNQNTLFTETKENIIINYDKIIIDSDYKFDINVIKVIIEKEFDIDVKIIINNNLNEDINVFLEDKIDFEDLIDYDKSIIFYNSEKNKLVSNKINISKKSEINLEYTTNKEYKNRINNPNLITSKSYNTKLYFMKNKYQWLAKQIPLKTKILAASLCAIFLITSILYLKRYIHRRKELV